MFMLPELASITNIDNGNVINGSQFNDICGRFSKENELWQHGRVAIKCDDPQLTLVALFSVWRSGRCACLLSSKLSSPELHNINDKTKISCLLSDS